MEVKKTKTEAKSKAEPKAVTKDSVTKDSVTKDSVTKDSVTKDSTTKDSVTKDSVTKDSVTKDSTTKDSVTKDSVTKDSVTKDSVTKDSVTKDSVTKDSVTKDSTTKDSVTKDSVTKDSVTKDSTTKDSVTKDSVTKDSVTKDSVTKDSVTKDSVTKDSVTKDSVTKDSVTKDSITKDSTIKAKIETKTKITKKSSSDKDKSNILGASSSPKTKIAKSVKSDSLGTMAGTKNYKHLESSFKLRDGGECYWQAWIADASYKRNLVIQHGLGEHSGRYSNIVTSFVVKKVNVFSYDIRGHGKTKGKRGDIKSIGQLASDFEIFLTLLEKKYNVIKPVLYAHSVGAFIALLFAVRHSNQCHLSALILSGTPLYPFMNIQKKIKILMDRLLYLMWPTLIISSEINVDGLSHDKQLIEAYLKDPLVHDRISLNLAIGLYDFKKIILSKLSKLKIPVMLIHGGGDPIVKHFGSSTIYKGISSKEKKLMIYSNLYHEIHNELAGERKVILRNLQDWFDVHQ